MSSTVFTGPLIAGNVLNSDGTGNLAGVGGSSGTSNIGFCEMVQTSAIVQSATAAGTLIVIPAQSLITSIDLFITTAWTNSATLSIGTSTTSTELATAITVSSTGKVAVTPGTLANWLNSSATSDVLIYVKSSAAPSGGTGAATLVVRYVQAINGFTNEQYT